MSASIFGYIILLCYYFHPVLFLAHGFQPIRTVARAPPRVDSQHENGEHRTYLGHFSASTSVDGGICYDDNLINAASKKLDWEITEERSQKPILNLSLRDVSPEETTNNTDDDDDLLEWNRGQRWSISVKYLSELGVFANNGPSSAPDESDSVLLKNCPQLFRLDPSIIQGTAQWIISEFGLRYLQAAVIRDGNSILLSFQKEDAAYGLEFMSVMMMTDAKTACAASSAFLLEAIRGGIQERAVSAALGAAGNATSKASKSIASDTMESFRQLRDANRNKK